MTFNLSTTHTGEAWLDEHDEKNLKRKFSIENEENFGDYKIFIDSRFVTDFFLFLSQKNTTNYLKQS